MEYSSRKGQIDLKISGCRKERKILISSTDVFSRTSEYDTGTV
jgi:hypothetical protein